MIPLPSKSSANVAHAVLENILSRYGVPAVILTDQGTEFQGAFLDLMAKQEITHRIASRENPQADGLAERMVQTLKQSLRRCLLDQSWGVPWDDILPYVAMGYRISKQKSTGYSPYFLLYGRQPLFPATIQHLEENIIDNSEPEPKRFKLDLEKRTADLKEVMPLAMRNMAISQQRDEERFRHVRGGKWDRPKVKFVVGEYVMLRQKKAHTLMPSVRPHILRIVELRAAGVVILQGRDGTTISHQTSQIARCSVPISDKKIYPELFVKTGSVHCEVCGSKAKEAIMVMCELCNKGYHTTCIYPPLDRIPANGWRCEKH